MDKFAIVISFVVLLLSITVSYIQFMKYSTDRKMAKTGILFVSNATKAHNAYLKACKYVQNILYIKINEDREETLPAISKQIVNLYSKPTSQCGNLDIRLVLKSSDKMKNIRTSHPVDVLMYDSVLSKEVDKLRLSVATLSNNFELQSIEFPEIINDNTSNEQVKTYEYVALGGTFDRLHNGHKILLSQAALRATKHLTVGVTDVNMIQSKKLWELIEPVEVRIKAVLDFLMDINPNIEYNVLPIQDLYGPTKDDPRFQLIVVSEETVRGAEKINAKRAENNLPSLDMYTIQLAEDRKHNDEEEMKVSSSNQRMRLLGTTLRPAQPNPHIPDWPYIIGLAGGIASGKSSIMEKLRAKGAAIVNCDVIAHELYKPGLPLNATISQTFGRHVITEAGEVDRRKLGEIVFGDQEQLDRLNQLVWPEVLKEAQRRVKAFGDEGYRVVVIEAAVMVQARWYTSCHQLWSVIIPPNEAVKRLQKRNNLTEEEAKKRIASQPSNLEQIAHANIVFSPYWSYNHTQSQVDRAWEHLQNFLDKRK